MYEFSNRINKPKCDNECVRKKKQNYNKNDKKRERKQQHTTDTHTNTHACKQASKHIKWKALIYFRDLWISWIESILAQMYTSKCI